MTAMKDTLWKLMFNVLKIYVLSAYRNEYVIKVEKRVAKLHDKEKYFIHIRTLKQALYHELILKKCKESLNLIKRFD